MCWVKEGCGSLKPQACSSLPLEVVDQVDKFNATKSNLHLNKGCYTGDKLQAQLDNAPASCNPPCFRITKPGEYCYMSTRNNNFSNRRHIGQIIVTESNASAWTILKLLKSFTVLVIGYWWQFLLCVCQHIAHVLRLQLSDHYNFHFVKAKIFLSILDSNMWLWRNRVLEYSRHTRYVTYTWNIRIEYGGIRSVDNRSWIFVKVYHTSVVLLDVWWQTLC